MNKWPTTSINDEIKPATTLPNPIPIAISLKASATATLASPTAKSLIYETTSVNVLITFSNLKRKQEMKEENFQ